MLIISLTITGETPTGVSLIALTRVDTGDPVTTLSLPAAFTLANGAWSVSFTYPVAGLVFAYQARVTWTDGSSTDTFGTIVDNATQANALNSADDEGNTVIVAGDDCTQGTLADRRLTYRIPGFGGSITGATVVWKIVPRAAYDRSGDAAAELTVAGTVTLVNGTLIIRVALTRTQTAALRHVSLTPSDPRYKVQVSLVSSTGETLTEVLADAVVLKNVR